MYCDLCHVKITPSKITKSKGWCPICCRYINMSNHNTKDRNDNPYDQESIKSIFEFFEGRQLNEVLDKITDKEVCWLTEMGHLTFNKMCYDYFRI